MKLYDNQINLYFMGFDVDARARSQEETWCLQGYQECLGSPLFIVCLF